jgi:type IV pilus biogenesis protein CpaD/CtpE
MNWALVCLFAISLAGCGARHESTSAAAPAKTSAPTPPAQGEVTDEKIGLPSYPGATEVEYTRVRMHNDTGDTYSVHYKTSDSPAQVAAFYRVEGAKLGTLQKDSIAIGEQLQSVGVDRTDGSRSAIQASTDGKGVTIISLHRFIPAK